MKRIIIQNRLLEKKRLMCLRMNLEKMRRRLKMRMALRTIIC
ncbi:hypothetical protein LINPERHAP2_LOCUS3378 [Linum perenne]